MPRSYKITKEERERRAGWMRKLRASLDPTLVSEMNRQAALAGWRIKKSKQSSPPEDSPSEDSPNEEVVDTSILSPPEEVVDTISPSGDIPNGDT